MKQGNANYILYKPWHGFLYKRSFEMQPLEFQTDTFMNMKNGQQIDVLIMDFSKAFDIVGHHKISKKLDYYETEAKSTDGSRHSWLAEHSKWSR